MTAVWTIPPRKGRGRINPVASISNWPNFYHKVVHDLVLIGKPQIWRQEAHRMSVRKGLSSISA